MGNTKVADLIYTAQLSGAMYNMGGFAVQQPIDAWKVGFSMRNVNYGTSDQYAQFFAGANYTLAKNATAFLTTRSLGLAKGLGDAFEFGMKYPFKSVQSSFLQIF